MGTGSSIQLKSSHFPSPSTIFTSTRPITINNNRPNLLVAKIDRLATETTQTSTSNDGSPPGKPAPEPINEPTPYPKPPTQPRSKLTAREKLKAARVRSRSNEPKPVKKPPQLGSKVLEALRESDRITGKKRTGLPEAPTNMLDDSKRGMPKKGLTFELPVGWDVFLIILSVVVISTIMFTTTFVVWKMGAIHFNEY